MSILWIVDRDGPNLQAAFSFLPNNTPTDIIVDIRRTTTLQQTIAEVRNRVQTPVNLVRLVSHGDAGRLLFSNGTITSENVSALQFLRGLVRAPALIGSPSIETHGCGVAADFLPPPQREQGIGGVVTLNYGNMQGQMRWGGSAGLVSSRGIRFLLAMARACQKCVKGGIDYQHPDARWEFEGPSFTVCPTGQATLQDPQNRLGFGENYSFRVN